MLLLSDIEKLLQDRKPTVVARETGLSYQTVWRIAKGKYQAVNYETVRKLSNYFHAQGK